MDMDFCSESVRPNRIFENIETELPKRDADLTLRDDPETKKLVIDKPFPIRTGLRILMELPISIASSTESA
jgi:hypothetical protein